MVYSNKKITSLLNNDCVFLCNKTEVKDFLDKNTATKVFLIDNKETYLAESDIDNNKTSYTLCREISADYSIENTIALINQDECIVIKNSNEEKIGFINFETISKALLFNYKRLQAYLHTILDTIDESCTVIDNEEKVVFWTKGAEEIFSVAESEIIGKPITDFFSKERLEILNTLNTGESVRHGQHQARKDLVVMINSNPVYLNKEIIGAVVSETDITSQIRLNNELFHASEKLFNLEEEVRKTLPEHNPFNYIRGNSPALKESINITRKAATTNASVLIYGESGVGKELFAKAIHNLRETPDAPFIAINCGAIPSGLFESEIFGYEKGAFSGADQKGKKGKVELARNGTLFLDEIGEMPLEMQVKILRLLQEKKFFAVGGTKEIEVDFRVVAATNRNLKELVDEGKFREDLYYRLNVVNFIVPPLRDRPEDIIELTHYFLNEISVKYNKPIHGISQTVMQNLLKHKWPGNIRELKNVIERLVVFSENGEIQHTHLPSELNQANQSVGEINDVNSFPSQEDDDRSLKDRVQEYEKQILIQELEKVDGNKLLCAKNLQITRATLYNRLNRLGIED